MRFPISAFCLTLLISAFPPILGCTHSPRQAKDDRYLKVGDKFYRSRDGKLYVKTRAVKADLKPGPEFYREVPAIDVASYRDLGWYSLDKNHVYIEHESTCGLSISELEDADPATFSVFGYRWGKDSQHIWHNGIRLDGIKAVDLVVVPGQDPQFFDFVRDATRVFVGHQEIVGADAATFSCEKAADDPATVITSDKNFIWNTNEWNSESGFARTPK
ncbi:MAG: hypothetical protein CVU59_07340 [Deltaproteobacteria bacterium HGW-Deltaproteobacteria-17]|nr:MAG: hypothetical protein CVU59_07340 [Deltaproteobacteria bacterium HGW-Deltaproteobacteria-17]